MDGVFKNGTTTYDFVLGGKIRACSRGGSTSLQPWHGRGHSAYAREQTAILRRQLFSNAQMKRSVTAYSGPVELLRWALFAYFFVCLHISAAKVAIGTMRDNTVNGSCLSP